MHFPIQRLRCLRWTFFQRWIKSYISGGILSPFNCHFPGGPGFAGTRMSPVWILLELRVMQVVVTTGATDVQNSSQIIQLHPQVFTKCKCKWRSQCLLVVITGSPVCDVITGRPVCDVEYGQNVNAEAEWALSTVASSQATSSTVLYQQQQLHRLQITHTHAHTHTHTHTHARTCTHTHTRAHARTRTHTRTRMRTNTHTHTHAHTHTMIHWMMNPLIKKHLKIREQ